MGSRLTHDPYNLNADVEHDEWTVLVRVGEDEWRIGAGHPQEKADLKDAQGNNAGVDESWREAAKRYRRGARYQVILPVWAKNLLQRVRERAFIWKQLALELLDPPANSTRPWAFHYGRKRDGNNAGFHRGKQRGFRVSTTKIRKRKVRDSLQLGAIVGLALGCLSLVMFHQIAPSQPAVFNEPANAAIGNPATSKSQTLAVPAVRVYTVKIGTFSSENAVKTQSVALNKKRIWNTVQVFQGRFNLFSGVSLYPETLDAISQKAKTSGFHSKVQELEISLENVPVASGANEDDMTRVSEWLSATVGSLNTITGVAVNGEPSRDAKTAYASAQKLVPSGQALAETGYGKQLTQMETQWENAYAALEKGSTDTACRDALEGYLQLMSIHGEG